MRRSDLANRKVAVVVRSVRLFEFQAAKSPEFGGVLAVIDFPVEAVRESPGLQPVFCVLETPLDLLPSGGFERPSHADIVSSVHNMSEVEQKACREIVYNQIKSQGKKTNSEDVTDCNLVQYLPSAVRNIS